LEQSTDYLSFGTEFSCGFSHQEKMTEPLLFF